MKNIDQRKRNPGLKALRVSLVLLLSCLPVAAAAIEEGSGEVAVEEEVSSTGTDGEWVIGIENDQAGETTEGQIELDGGKLITGSIGDIDWEQTDSGLFGTLRSKDGSDVAYFTAELGGTGPLTGTFTTVGGQEGTWTWDGPVPTP